MLWRKSKGLLNVILFKAHLSKEICLKPHTYDYWCISQGFFYFFVCNWRPVYGRKVDLKKFNESKKKEQENNKKGKNR